METANLLIIFISSIFIGVTIYSVYIAIGPNSNTLRDPIEEHED
jgi:hypothetical protein